VRIKISSGGGDHDVKVGYMLDNFDRKVFGIIPPPKSVHEIAAKYGYPSDNLSLERIDLLKDLAQADYDLDVATEGEKNSRSPWGPVITAVIGVFLTIWLIGILFIIAGIAWYLIRVNAQPKFANQKRDADDRVAALKRKLAITQ
jgi:hypothetical protein